MKIFEDPLDKIITQFEILEIIKSHIGEAHAITRGELLDMLLKRGYKLDDRKMRDAISNLRKSFDEGAKICSYQNGKGYFYAETKEEFLKYIQPQKNRGRTILKIAYAQERRAFPDLSGQVELNP
jgi:hypothetical protein